MLRATIPSDPVQAHYQNRLQSIDAAELASKTLHRRAVEAAIWGMPIVSVDAMCQGFFGTGSTFGDIVYLSKPADWRFQITTPNSSSLYVYSNFNLSDGPVVLEVPPAAGAGLFGSILDAWQIPIADVGPEGEDAGRGGKYLLIPPDFQRAAPPGYIPLRFATYNGYAALRAIPRTSSPEDTAKALDLAKQLRFYPLSEADHPPPQRHNDIAGRHFEGIVKFDDSFYSSLAKMINEEPVQTRDLAAMGPLATLGIEKGKDFDPDHATRAILNNAITEAHAYFTDLVVGHIIPYWPNSQWGMPPLVASGAKTGFSFQTANSLDVDARGATYFSACAAPKKLGAATLYLLGATDSNGAPLNGSHCYRLRIPPNVPARQFWAVTVYDLDSASFIRDSPKTEVNSYHDLQYEKNGSIEIFFGPKAPPNMERNWIYTEPCKRWITFFRFYGPQPAIRNKTWTLNDIEEMK